jgi:hypothetical protein
MNMRVLFAPDEPPAGGPVPGKDAPANDKPAGETPPTFESWLEAQPADVKTLYESHTQGLRNTVQATRDERDQLKKQLKDLGKTLEEGSAAKKTVDEMSTKLEDATRKAEFFEAAARPGIELLDAAVAWLVVQTDSKYMDSRGNVKFDLLKQEHPALFGKPVVPTAHAGAGRDGDQSLSGKDMNNFIRTAAGKR